MYCVYIVANFIDLFTLFCVVYDMYIVVDMFSLINLPIKK